jgi:hypothetical protein
VLTGGPDSSGFVRCVAATDDAEGTVRLRGRVDLGVQHPAEGNIGLIVDPNVRVNADGQRVVDVSIPCAGPAAEIEVSVSIRQRAGRQGRLASTVCASESGQGCRLLLAQTIRRKHVRAGCEDRTRHLMITSQALYQLS